MKNNFLLVIIPLVCAPSLWASNKKALDKAAAERAFDNAEKLLAKECISINKKKKHITSVSLSAQTTLWLNSIVAIDALARA